MKKIATILFAMFLFITNVNAASLCSYKEQTELNQKAANVKVSYEVAEKILQFEDMNTTEEVFDISILNITEELYVVIKNDKTNEEKTITYSETNDGVATYRWEYAEAVTNFTIEVYTTEKTSCPYEKFKTLYLTTPRYNEFFNREVCQENSEFYLCQKYVVFSEIDETKFLEQLDSYQNGTINNDGENIGNLELSLTDKIFNFINEYKWYIIGGILIVSASIVVIYRIKTKKQRDLGL